MSKRSYLIRACHRLADEVADIDGSWWCYGPVGEGPVGKSLVGESPVEKDPASKGSVSKSPLTKRGHPRHPSRLSYSWALQRFDVQSYILQLA